MYFPTTGIELSIAEIPNAITVTTANTHAIESTGFPNVSESNPTRSRDVRISGCTKYAPKLYLDNLKSSGVRRLGLNL